MLGELTDEQMETLLRSEHVAHLGCYGNGEVYVVPVAYVYENGSVFGHTHDGLKVQMMRQHPRVCLEVDRMLDLANWQSVIAWGIFEELKGAAAGAAIELLVDRFRPMLRGATALPLHAINPLTRRRLDAHGHRAVIYRIVLDTVTGRYERE